MIDNAADKTRGLPFGRSGKDRENLSRQGTAAECAGKTGSVDNEKRGILKILAQEKNS